MEPTETTCVMCGRDGGKDDIGIWFVSNRRRPVHLDCWIAAYQNGRLPIQGKTA